ncbi:MAG: RES family NAD+ phosphorylase [Parabacteroides sp.]|nr:RES family NAD+ phosphorylase [Parabacteroides sp.]
MIITIYTKLYTISYIPTQYIAEYIKKLGFQAIKFNSSLDSSGRNVTIFTPEKCEAVSSNLYSIEDICFDTKCIAPTNQGDLIHRKLEPYKKKYIADLLRLPKAKAKDC